jgi:hypothetical protein
MSRATAPPSDTEQSALLFYSSATTAGSTLADGASTPITSQQQQLLDDRIRTIVQEALVAHQDTHGRAGGSSQAARAPPHVIVTCAKDRVAFSRFALLQMDYEVCMTIHTYPTIHDISIDRTLGRPHSPPSATSSWIPWTTLRSTHGCSPRFGINTA